MKSSLLKKVISALAAAVILAGCAAGFESSLVNAQDDTPEACTQEEYAQGKYNQEQTDEPSDHHEVKCYKSIEIQPGDSLWSIAEKNMDAHYTSVNEYIEEIKQINDLHSDLIHSGQYLSIAYYK